MASVGPPDCPTITFPFMFDTSVLKFAFAFWVFSQNAHNSCSGIWGLFSKTPTLYSLVHFDQFVNEKMKKMQKIAKLLSEYDFGYHLTRVPSGERPCEPGKIYHSRHFAWNVFRADGRHGTDNSVQSIQKSAIKKKVVAFSRKVEYHYNHSKDKF